MNYINKKYFPLFFLFIINLYPQSSYWIELESGVTTTLRDVYFINSSTGWIVGDSSTILYTTDEGKSWTKQISPLEGKKFNKVEFINPNSGYIVGDSGIILKTTNRGISWVHQNSGVLDNLLDIEILNDTLSIIVGCWSGGGDWRLRGGVVLKTINNGGSWQKVIESRWGNVTYHQLFQTVKFLDEKNGWMLGGLFFDNFDNTELYRSTDGGNNWYIISSPFGLLSELCVISPDTIWVGGMNGVQVTTNGGINWEIMDFYSPEDTIFQYPGFIGSDFVFSNNHELYTLLGFLGKKVNFIKYTNTTGEHWKNLPSPDPPTLLAMELLNNGRIILVGGEGRILISNDEVTDADIYDFIAQMKGKYLSCYPNPFNSSTNILITKDQSNVSSVKIYNILGKEVVTLYNNFSNKISNHYSIKFEPAEYGLSSGVYICQVTFNDSSKSLKIIYQK